MSEHDRVRLASDRPTRLLFGALWIAPVAVPLALVCAYGWTGDAGARRAAAAISPLPREVVAAPTPFVAPLPAPASVPLSGTHVLRDVVIGDGLALQSGALVVSLFGVAPFSAAAQCKRLDGVAESCVQRAQARLEILTRDKPVTCAMKEKRGDDMYGVCRAGKIDLADDLLRNGLALRAD